MSAVRNREASVSRRLTMYYSGRYFNPCYGLCPLYGGCPPLGGSVMGGSTVYIYIYIYIIYTFVNITQYTSTLWDG